MTFGMMKPEFTSISEIYEPAYRFARPGTLLFVNGAPLSGKSTVSLSLAANIYGCNVQNMDILRLAAQEVDKMRPTIVQEEVLMYGSCDSYRAVGNGAYSPEALITGYRRYSEATCWLMHRIIPSLEKQGASDVLFEGVQLLPSTVGKYLNSHNKMITITSNPQNLLDNRNKLFGVELEEMNERYSVDKLMMVQQEIIRQTKTLSTDQFYHANNTGRYIETVKSILNFLNSSGVIVPNI